MENINVTVSNLGNMNFATLSLPATVEEVKAFFAKLNPFGNDCEVVDVAFDREQLYDLFGWADRLTVDQLNQVAGMEEVEAFAMIYQAADNDFDRALEIMEEGSYRIFWECKNDYDLGYDLATESGLIDPDSDSVLHRYFDFRQFGHDCSIEGNFTRIDSETVIELF